MTVVSSLRKARALIKNPKRWTQKQPARDADGDDIDCRHKEAVCWCALGAIWKVENRLDGPAYTLLSGIAFDLGTSVPVINDGRHPYQGLMGHAAIMRLYDDAIAIAEQTGAAA